MILIEKDGNGISAVDGKNLIKRDSNGVVSIGENSLKTAEVGGIQKLYATDASGDAIPINITEGSDLQINGVSVQGQITDRTDPLKKRNILVHHQAPCSRLSEHYPRSGTVKQQITQSD